MNVQIKNNIVVCPICKANLQILDKVGGGVVIRTRTTCVHFIKAVHNAVDDKYYAVFKSEVN
jgi:uncharacterized protein YbaR (Trm112 family)